MDIQELEKIIKGRRSIRRWKNQEVPDDMLKKAVELATWAPNGGNFQGWRFIVVKNRQVIENMANAVQAVADKIASWPESAAWPEEMERASEERLLLQECPCLHSHLRRPLSKPDR